MGILMLIFSLCRIVFYIRNAAYFPEAGISEFMTGMWFDLIATCLLFFPLIIIELFPNKNRKARWFRITLKVVTGIVFFTGILVNLIDIEYFAHTSSRSGSSLFVMLGFGNDLFNQLPSFFRDYWYILILLIAFLIGVWWILKHIYSTKDDSLDVNTWKQLGIMVFTGALAVFIARGGFVHKPIRPTQASKYTEASNIPLVLNTAFTVINSFGASPLEEKTFMSQKEALTLFNPIHNYAGNQRLKDQNICIIILESFTIEFINSLNVDQEDWAPFFDELADSSLVFTHAFANGKKSIDAVPAIISSIPKMMRDEFLLSSYSVNQLESLPEIMDKMGYSTGFYHGATNGSMNFDAFSAMAGFASYYGRSEYNNDAHYDGTWGIYDEEFMTWSIDRFSEMKEPFFTTLFTISSHPPYSLPKKYEEKYKNAPTEMHKVIQYTDFSLQQFFHKARKQDWFDHTLFVITADHTPGSKRSMYLHDRGKMHIPLMLYHPTDTFFRGRNDKIVGQIDIMPTLLDLLGYQQDFFSFGRSVFENTPGFTFSEVSDKKMLIETVNGHSYTLVYQNEQAIALYDFDDIHHKHNLINEKADVVDQMTRKLQAVIQVHNNVMIRNKMTAERYGN